MRISDSFKNDIVSKNTNIIPLVVIEKLIDDVGLPILTADNVYDRVFISTNSVQVQEYQSDLTHSHYFKPLLLDIPKITQKVDLSTGKYQTSSVKLNISNTDYNNSKRLSEKLDSYSLINTVVCIYYKSQSCTTINMPYVTSHGYLTDTTTGHNVFDQSNGCPRVYSGVIRDVSHTKDKITLSLEDISDKKMNKDLPIHRLGSDDNIPDRYKNSYIPML